MVEATRLFLLIQRFNIMSKYTITHGSIAAVQYITLPDGSKVTVTDAKDGSERDLPKLPLERFKRLSIVNLALSLHCPMIAVKVLLITQSLLK
jgi:hypothetical protein